jgi:hypothetical protein
MELGIVLGLILIPLQVYFGIAKMDSIIAMKNNLVEPGFDSGWRIVPRCMGKRGWKNERY